MFFRTLIMGMVSALCAVSAFANVPPLVRIERVGFLHDRLGRVITMTSPDQATEHNAYDALGNLLRYTNAINVAAVTSAVFSVRSVVNYSHDHNGNRTALLLPGNKTAGSLGTWAADGSAYLQQTMDETYPWQISGTLNAVIQLGQGFITTPQAIGHLGEGTGTFLGDPTLENSAGMFSDISLASGVMASTLSALPSGRAPLGSQTQVDGPTASAPVGHQGSPLSGSGANSPTQINGRSYSGHALDQMQNRGFTPSVVEHTISTGQAFPGNTAGTIGYYDPVNNISVIQNSQTGNIITVRPGTP